MQTAPGVVAARAVRDAGLRPATATSRRRASDAAAWKARRARPADAPTIHALIAEFAATGALLARELAEIREHVDRFLVLVEKGKLLGCVALEPYGASLAEIRSLAVAGSAQGRGLGARLLDFSLAEARRRGFARVFAVTHAPGVFEKHGFARTSRHAVPEKIERDCHGCPKERHCEKLALVAVVAPERAALPIMQPVECAG